MGNWKHPLYKKVEFTQQDFDDMQQNFSTNVLGFEPPLFLGHADDSVTTGKDGISYKTMEGAPAEGFLARIYQEGEVLYTEFEIVNEQVYTSVQEGRYRYASGEFVRNYANKDDGKSVGTVLVGMALTNRPFIPELPRVTALCEASTALNNCTDERLNSLLYLEVEEPIQTDISLSLPPMQNQESSTKENSNSNTASEAVSSTSLLSDMQARLSSYSEELNAVKLAYQQQLTDALGQIDLLNQQVNAAKAEREQKEKDEKIAKISALCLPADVKQSYCDMIQSGKLGSSTDDVVSTLVQMGQMFSDRVLTQHGESQETSAVNDPEKDSPFNDIISKNIQLAEAKRKRLADQAMTQLQSPTV
jgi:hypothetical protein